MTTHVQQTRARTCESKPSRSPLVLLAMAMAFCSVVHPGVAAADEASDRSALTTCLDAHTSPTDRQSIQQLLGVAIASASSSGAVASDVPKDLLSTRDTALTNLANLITRLTDQDCKTEVHAVAANKLPNGGAFAIIFSQLMKQIQPALERAGIVMGLDLIKKMDPGVVMELGVSAPSGPAAGDAASTPSGPQAVRRTAVSGVRLRLDFAAALNPDCSAQGEITTRILTPPAHGTAAVEAGSGFTAYPSTNQRYHCNEKAQSGKILFYKSNSGYMGPDSFTYQTIYPNGVEQRFSMELTVN
jgi:hypothetical protein